MKQMIQKMYHPTNKALGLFVLRLTLGAIFMYAGIFKLMDMNMTIGFFATVGLGAFWAWVVALVETVGGAMVILGLWTRLWALLLAVTMIVAIWISRNAGFQMIQLPIVLLGLSLGVGLIGCGSWSVCRIWHKKDCGTCQAGGEHCGCTCDPK